MSSAQTWFLASAILLAYTYVGYPLVIWLCSLLSRSRTSAAVSARTEVPARQRISILVVAHNEAQRIDDRIENLLALDYPQSLLEIVIASDGSTDGTAERASRHHKAGIRVVEFPHQRGKPAVLNELVPQLHGEVVVLMDVRQRIEPDALNALVTHFADSATGAVSGELLLHPRSGNSQSGHGAGFYWRYEKFIRLHESHVNSTIGTTGALYALRKRLFRPIPANMILDDVLIPMYIARQGYRVLFEPGAVAHDFVAASAEAELTRKVRTIAGNFQLLWSERWLLNPLANRLWFQTVSHKFCRLAGPLLLLVLQASNWLLLDSAFYRECLLLQLLFYMAAASGHGTAVTRRPFVNIAYTFCLLNWATVLGFWRFARGRQQVTWQQVQN